MTLPILYSFRRCPYAMRARLALRVCGIQVVLREVVLSDKPAAMLACSTKATVPVLALEDRRVIDESLDIMYWALNQHDPQGWLVTESDLQDESRRLIAYNDDFFKSLLDRYKYADRYPEQSMEVYREQCEGFLCELEERLAASTCLVCNRPTLADMAILPFIRQFANVDENWFAQSPYSRLNGWLTTLLNLSLFTVVMRKYKKWHEGDQEVVF